MKLYRPVGGLFLFFASYFVQVGNVEAVAPATCVDQLNRKIASMVPITQDISFMIADLKFDGKQVKICEFGEGTRSRFKGYDYLYGKGLIWERFWKVLDQYSFPKWYVDFNLLPSDDMTELYEEIALEDFLQRPRSQIFSSLADLVGSKRFERALEKSRTQGQPAALCMVRHYDASVGMIETLRKHYKNLLVLNAAVAPFVNNKYTTDVLFKDEALQKFRPQALLCRRAYTSGLADSIKKKMPVTHYVIKPLDAFKGCGIVMVEAGDLDQTLRTILDKNSHKPKDFTVHYNGYSYTDKTYSYWATYSEPYFIVEELSHSKILTFDGKRYDPTLRAVFVLHHRGGIEKIDYLAAYWKLPLKSLDEPGTLTEKYKSVGIIPIDTTPEERKTLYAQLDELLLPLYRKMINIINTKTKLSVPLQA